MGMTNEELVYALRNNVGVSDYSRVVANLAADHIEQIKNNHWQIDAMQQNALLNDALSRAEVAEAKLAELESGLEVIGEKARQALKC